MRVLVTGSRDWRDVDTISDAMRLLPEGSTVVHGAASGADAIAHSLATEWGHTPEPHWPNYARDPANKAPLWRNNHMVNLGADLCLAFPTEGSRGTWHCVQAAERAGISVIVIKNSGDVTDLDDWFIAHQRNEA